MRRLIVVCFRPAHRVSDNLGRDVIVPRPEATENPDLVVLPGGRTFYLQQRLLATSLFGGVFHGIEGFCADENE